jgi:Holliday junction resolvase RusA-like endonuclease
MIKIPMKALSLNNAKTFSFKSKRFHKKKSTYNYESEFSNYLTNQSEEIKKVALSYSNEKYFKLEAYFYMKEFYTKDKRISARSGDLDNCLKISIDLIFKFLKKFNDKIDDKQICSIVCDKIPSDNDCMVFHITSHSLSSLKLQ